MLRFKAYELDKARHLAWYFSHQASAAARDAGRYLADGTRAEDPGRWHLGKGSAKLLGLRHGANVEDSDLRALMHLHHPEVSRRMAELQERCRAAVDDAERAQLMAELEQLEGERLRPLGPNNARHGDGKTRAAETTAAVDMLISVPKSISVQWALAPSTEREELKQILYESVDEAIAYMLDRGILAYRQRAGERGRDGKRAIRRLPAKEVVAAQFLHTTARPARRGDPHPDPHLHIHTLLLGVIRADDRYAAIEERSLMRSRAVLSALVDAFAVRRLVELGYHVRVWEGRDGRYYGLTDDFIPDGVTKAFQGRSEQVTSAIEEMIADWETEAEGAGPEAEVARKRLAAYYAAGEQLSPRAKELAFRKDRAPKTTRRGRRARGDKELEEAETDERWSRIARDLGARHVAPLPGRGRRDGVVVDREELCAEIARRLTDRSPVADRRTLYARVLEVAGQAWDHNAALELVADLEHGGYPEIVRLDVGPGWVGNASDVDGTAPPPYVFTTRQQLEVEERALREMRALLQAEGEPVRASLARRARSRMRGWAGDRVDEAVWEEQRRALELALDGGRVAQIQGVAGSGKSTLLTAAVWAHLESGRAVHALATTGEIAARFERKARERGVELSSARSIRSLLGAATRDAIPMAEGDVLILDETSQTGTQERAELYELCNRRGLRLIEVGDSEQLRPVSAAGLEERLDAMVQAAGRRARLSATVRARHELDRRVQQRWVRARDSEGAVAALEPLWREGRIHIYETEREMREAIALRAAEHRQAGVDSLTIGELANEELDDLNEHIQRLAHGGRYSTLAKLDVPDRQYSIVKGDRVVFRRSWRVARADERELAATQRQLKRLKTRRGKSEDAAERRRLQKQIQQLDKPNRRGTAPVRWERFRNGLAGVVETVGAVPAVVLSADEERLRAAGGDVPAAVLKLDDGRRVTMTREDLRAADLRLAYASHPFPGEGIEVDVGEGIVGPYSTKRGTYVALSRGREANHLHASREALEEERKRAARKLDEEAHETELAAMLRCRGLRSAGKLSKHDRAQVAVRVERRWEREARVQLGREACERTREQRGTDAELPPEEREAIRSTIDNEAVAARAKELETVAVDRRAMANLLVRDERERPAIEALERAKEEAKTRLGIADARRAERIAEAEPGEELELAEKFAHVSDQELQARIEAHERERDGGNSLPSARREAKAAAEQRGRLEERLRRTTAKRPRGLSRSDHKARIESQAADLDAAREEEGKAEASLGAAEQQETRRYEPRERRHEAAEAAKEVGLRARGVSKAEAERVREERERRQFERERLAEEARGLQAQNARAAAARIADRLAELDAEAKAAAREKTRDKAGAKSQADAGEELIRAYVAIERAKDRTRTLKDQGLANALVDQGRTTEGRRVAAGNKLDADLEALIESFGDAMFEIRQAASTAIWVAHGHKRVEPEEAHKRELERRIAHERRRELRDTRRARRIERRKRGEGDAEIALAEWGEELAEAARRLLTSRDAHKADQEELRRHRVKLIRSAHGRAAGNGSGLLGAALLLRRDFVDGWLRSEEDRAKKRALELALQEQRLRDRSAERASHRTGRRRRRDGLER
jgi:hypothetical protein